MKRHKSVKGATLLDNTIGLAVASGLTAISLTQAPAFLDSADKAALHYIQQSERSADKLYQQYSLAKGIEVETPQVELYGVQRHEKHVASPLGQYCYNSNKLDADLSLCIAAE